MHIASVVLEAASLRSELSAASLRSELSAQLVAVH